LASQLGAIVLKVGSAAVGLPVISSQRQGDQFFQALAHWIGCIPPDSILTSIVTDTFERILAGRLLPLPPTADSLDKLNWEEVSYDLNGKGAADRGQRNPPASQAPLPASGSHGAVDQASLEQCFSQLITADLTAVDE
jgi:hypothetical protein